MSEQAYLALYFDAPLQSWGCQSKFDRRATLAYPTRSGVIGLLCAALGIDRADTAGLTRLDGLDLHVVALRHGGRLTDYHTVGGGYDPRRRRMSIPRKAGGGVGTTVQSWREYIETARFGVVVRGARPLLAELEEALRNPRWGVWLGRKSCIPAARISEGIFATEHEAIEQLCRVAGVAKPLRHVREAADFESGNDTLPDRPLDFTARVFAPRRVYVDTE